MAEKKTGSTSRRQFLRRSALGAMAAGIALPGRAASPEREFKVGLIGCGGRGNGAANDAIEAGKMNGDKVVIHAVADLFRDKAERARRSFGVPTERTFVGFDAFQRLVESECDYVILATPPHFRPEHFEAAINAGKHVFTEKPVGVDAPGIRRFLAAGKKAKEKGLSVAAGTQRRHAEEYVETKRRIDDGAIGQIVNARCYWNQGGLWTRDREEGWSDIEWQVRNWLYFTWLSGDHIVEQHVHNLDVVNWFIGTHPIAARGMGGRQVRTGKDVYGNIFDHFATELIYPSPNPSAFPDVRVTSMCRQIEGCWNDVSEFFVGTEGSCATNQGKNACRIFGPNKFVFDRDRVNPYVQEHRDLQDSIKKGGGELNESESVAHSTFTAILARTSCYTGRHLEWDALLASDERFGPEKYEFSDFPIPPVAQPGKPS
jgi:myo-inositol 2-dehydrogenase/D-chiro-inositol 1-dehydrogenase